MAFKIRNEEELSLLTNYKYEQYKRELELNEERNAFFEQIEALEHANIEPYKPQLQLIPVIKKVKVESFKKAEYALTKWEPIVKASLKIKTLEKLERKKPILPILAEKPNVPTYYMKKPVKFNLELPTVSKVEVVTKSFQPIEVKPSLPAVEQPSPVAISFKPLKKTQHTMPKICMPELYIKPFIAPDVKPLGLSKVATVITKVDISSFKAIELPKVSLPKVPISEKKDSNLKFQKPELSKIQLPRVAKSSVHVPLFKKMARNPVGLPKVSKPEIEIKPFQKADLSKIDMLTVVKPSVHVPPFEKVARNPVGLPKVSMPEIKIQPFQKPEQSKVDLEPVKPMKVDIKPFEKPQSIYHIMPKIEVSSVSVRSFQPIEKLKPQIDQMIMPEVNVPSFTRPKKDKIKLPKVVVGSMPDLETSLKEILALMYKEAQ
jgi:hypothetical protein